MGHRVRFGEGVFCPPQGNWTRASSSKPRTAGESRWKWVRAATGRSARSKSMAALDSKMTVGWEVKKTEALDFTVMEMGQRNKGG